MRLLYTGVLFEFSWVVNFTENCLELAVQVLGAAIY